MRRKQSPSYDPASTEVGLAEPEWGMGVRSLTEVEEDPFASGEMEDPFALEVGRDEELDTAECLARGSSSEDEESDLSDLSLSSVPSR